MFCLFSIRLNSKIQVLGFSTENKSFKLVANLAIKTDKL